MVPHHRRIIAAAQSGSAGGAGGTWLVAETNENLEEAARHLGHASLETTRVYAKWSDATLRETVGAW